MGILKGSAESALGPRLGHSALSARCPVCPKPDMSVIDVAVRPELSRTVPLLPQCRWSGQRHPHRIEAELISALAMGTNLDVAAADQSRPSATRAAKLTHPMRRIFHPSSWQDGARTFFAVRM